MPAPPSSQPPSEAGQKDEAWAGAPLSESAPHAGATERVRAGLVAMKGEKPDLARLGPEEQKNELGRRLYELVASIEPEQASRVTGKLLELDTGEVRRSRVQRWGMRWLHGGRRGRARAHAARREKRAHPLR